MKMTAVFEKEKLKQYYIHYTVDLFAVDFQVTMMMVSVLEKSMQQMGHYNHYSVDLFAVGDGAIGVAASIK